MNVEEIFYADITCFQCKQTGHYSLDCKLPPNGTQNIDPQNKPTSPNLKKPGETLALVAVPIQPQLENNLGSSAAKTGAILGQSLIEHYSF